MSNIEGLLDEPVGKRIKNGYLWCTNCGRYRHHPTRWCPSCGTELTREKEMIWRDFLAKTTGGAGPLNTIYSILGGWKFDGGLTGIRKEIYAEAKKIERTSNPRP